MAQHQTQPQAMSDGYYSEDELDLDVDELDLSFLDDEE